MIKVNHLSKKFGNLEVLKDINLDINEGEVVCIIGPSGSGKSTFLRCINQLERPTGGTVQYEGKNLLDKNCDIRKFREEVGMVFQKPNPFPMSIYDNIAYGPRTHGIRSKAKLDDIVEQSLRQAAIWDEVKDRLKKNALGLSGGQQQRLCIARAMAVSPSVLLMDEPASALDPISTAKVEELIHELKKDYTIVIVTHNMQQAARVSDKTAFFYLGEMVEYGDTKRIFTNPEKEATQNYITGRFG